jgi:transcriptional regulator with XRE-family HTH domain
MPTMEAVKIDAKKLQDARLAKFWSRDELAKASGINRDHIGRLERGYEGESRPPTVRKLAEALDVDPRELLEGEAEDPD